jgi:hypothetical protein
MTGIDGEPPRRDPTHGELSMRATLIVGLSRPLVLSFRRLVLSALAALHAGSPTRAGRGTPR